MIDLPASLTPWARNLSRLTPELAVALAPWMGRLALALGPLTDLRSNRSGEPDGYAGLARRGSYERLVTGEWALAEMYPDEFVRRASAGEHLFLDLMRRGPRRATRSIAVVSAGPSQLGAPRLAHLAALVVLARRASLARARFCWGVLEDPDHSLSDDLDPAGIQRLLAARTALSADEDAIRAWRASLGDGGDLDWWWIGGPEGLAAARRAGASCLVVTDPLIPGTGVLDLDIHRRGAPGRIRLDLPAPEVCARLLRDPMSRSEGPRVTATSGRVVSVRFVPGGKRLLVTHASGRVESWPIPNSPKDQLGKPRVWSPPDGHRVVALGVGHRSCLAATVSANAPDQLEIHHGSHGHRVRVALPAPFAALLARRLDDHAGGPAGICGLVKLRSGRRTDLVIEVAPARLVVVPDVDLPLRGELLHAMRLSGIGAASERAIGLGATLEADRVQWAELRGDGAVHIVIAEPSGTPVVARLPVPADHRDPPPRLLFGYDDRSDAPWSPVAVSVDDDEWIAAAAGVSPTRHGVDHQVLGVGYWRESPRLLTRPHPFRLVWTDGAARELHSPATDEIVSVAVCPRRPCIAWLTTTGEVVVDSMAYRSLLMRLAPAQGGPG